MIPRILEPEVMETAGDAADYDSMDHLAVNRSFVADWYGQWRDLRGLATGEMVLHVLDVGTGTARIPIELCDQIQQLPRLQIMAIDLAEEMLKLATRNILEAFLDHRIKTQLVDAKQLPFEDDRFDTVISNSIMHHIPEPLGCLREMLRVLRPGGLLFVRDLFRPETDADVEQLVSTHACTATPRQQQLFRQSFHAALTLSEVADLLETTGLPRTAVTQTSDRHWTISTLVYT